MRGARRGGVAAIIVLALLVPRNALAWLPEGHLATGAIAYDALERHAPQAVAVILRLMLSHPDRPRSIATSATSATSRAAPGPAGLSS